MQEKPISALIEKIAKECGEADADKWTIARIVKELGAEETKSIKQLREQALQLLQQLDPKAGAVYASFQRMQVRTTAEQIEPFDRGNIIKSLLKETDVTRGVAEKIGGEVEDKIKDLEIEDINTALIREMVNVKLLEYGHEKIRNQYTRLGLPVAEVRKKIEQQPYACRAILTEYNLIEAIPHGIARMHLTSEIFIANLHDFGTRPAAASITPTVKESPQLTVIEALRSANIAGGYCSWQPNIKGLNAAVAASGNRKEAKEAMLLFERAAQAVFAREKEPGGFNCVHLFEPEAMQGEKINRETMVAGANSALKARQETNARGAFETAVAIDTKYKIKLLLHQPQETLFLNCKSKDLFLLNGIAAQNSGLCSFTALNLTGMALANSGNENGFFQALAQKAEAIKKLDELKRKTLSGREYLRKAGLNCSGFSSAVGIDSLLGASKIAIQGGETKAGLGFAERIVGELRKTLPENFVVAELTNKKALQRFAASNKKQFGRTQQYASEAKELQRSSQLQRNYFFTALAENKKELGDALDSNVRTVLLRKQAAE
ncbi:MAG: hypothetical protein NTW59_03545 [Candidatus Diapherotrites archaeon]|nr:hypothetical protein [Candidatus Diapherotrites archaeon]